MARITLPPPEKDTIEWEATPLPKGYVLYSHPGNDESDVVRKNFVFIHGLGRTHQDANSTVNGLHELQKDGETKRFNLYSLGVPTSKNPDLLQRIHGQKDPGLKEMSKDVVQILKGKPFGNKGLVLAGSSMGAKIAQGAAYSIVGNKDNDNPVIENLVLTAGPHAGSPQSDAWLPFIFKKQARDLSTKSGYFTRSEYLRKLHDSNINKVEELNKRTLNIYSQQDDTIPPSSALAISIPQGNTLSISWKKQNGNPQEYQAKIGQSATWDTKTKKFFYNGKPLSDLKETPEKEGHINILGAGHQIAQFIWDKTNDSPSHQIQSINLSAKSENHIGGIKFRHIYEGDAQGDVVIVTPGVTGTRKLFGKNFSRKLIDDFRREGKPEPHIVYAHYSSQKKPAIDPNLDDTAKYLSQALTQSKLLSNLLKPGIGVHVDGHSAGCFAMLEASRLNPDFAAKVRTFSGFGAPYGGLLPPAPPYLTVPYLKKAQVRDVQSGSDFLSNFEKNQKAAYGDQEPPFKIYNFAAKNDKYAGLRALHCPLGGEKHIVPDAQNSYIDGGHRTQVTDGKTASIVAEKMREATPENHAKSLKSASDASWKAYGETHDTQHLRRLLSYTREFGNLAAANHKTHSLDHIHLLHLLQDTAEAFQETYLKTGKEHDLHGAISCYEELRNRNPLHTSRYDKKAINLQKEHVGIIYKGHGRNPVDIERIEHPQGNGGKEGPTFIHLHGYEDGYPACGTFHDPNGDKLISVIGRSPRTINELPPGNHYIVHYPSGSPGCDDFATVARKAEKGLQISFPKHQRFVIKGHSAGGIVGMHLLSSENPNIRKRTDLFIASATPFNGPTETAQAYVKLLKNDPQGDELMPKSSASQERDKQWKAVFPDGKTPFKMVQLHIAGDQTVPESSSLSDSDMFRSATKRCLDIPLLSKLRNWRIDGLHRLPMGGLRKSYIWRGRELGTGGGSRKYGKEIRNIYEQYRSFVPPGVPQRPSSDSKTARSLEQVHTR